MSENKTNQIEKKDKGNGTGAWRIRLSLLVCLVAGICLGLYLWYQSQSEISTDDAFIESHIHTISSRIPGHVKEVFVHDNQKVTKGDLLLRLDPADYEARAAQAEALLAMAQNETSGNHARKAKERAAVYQCEAHLNQAQLDLKRGKALYAKEVVPKEQLDRLKTAKKVAEARLQEAREALHYAEIKLKTNGPGGKEAQVAQREAELRLARLNLSYARITAPANGFVTQKSVEIGSNIQPGQPLMTVVRLHKPWIVANYKESQLTHLNPGQKVEFTVDTYPGKAFAGSVDSIMSGTGAAFSLLPPENATGNYVKVVQRIPVKIAIDESSDPEHLLRVGMSVVPTVHTGLSFFETLRRFNPLD